MKLQAASKKEISRIAVGTLVCDVIMIAGLFLLSQFGIGKFDILRILLGAACGSVVAILNFTILCLTVQSAVEIDSKKKMRQKFQMSYNVRLLLQAVWVVDDRGLTVKEAQELRRNIREAGAVMKVYKNTLVHIALEDAELPTLDDMLNGPSAFVFAGEDVAAAAKAVKNFAKGNDKLEIKGGLMEGKAVTAAEVEAIASLPSRDELLAHIAAAINGVAKALAVCVNGVPQGLAQVTKAVADQKAA